MTTSGTTGPDALSDLADDHHHVRELVTQLETAVGDGDNVGATALAKEITDGLNANAAIEEEVFYPAVLQSAPELAPEVERALEQHQRAKQLLFEVVACGTDETGATAPDLELLHEAIGHHVSEEELFPSVRGALSHDELMHLAARVEARKEALEVASDAGRRRRERDDFDVGTPRPSRTSPPVGPPVVGLRRS
jgi:hypothetical protein